jgi:hypothetical protein
MRRSTFRPSASSKHVRARRSVPFVLFCGALAVVFALGWMTRRKPRPRSAAGPVPSVAAAQRAMPDFSELTSLRFLSTPADEAPSQPIMDNGEDLSAARPLTAGLRQSKAQKKVLYEAEEAAVATCMKQRGFEYQPNPYVDDSEVTQPGVRTELGDIAGATASGYGVSDAAEIGQVPLTYDANHERVEQMSETQRRAWEQALRGQDRPPPDPSHPDSDPSVGYVAVPSGPAMTWDRSSCFTVAQKAVYGDNETYLRLTLSINVAMNEVQNMVNRNPDVTAGLDKWRTCMRERGYSYERPGAAAGALSKQYWRGELPLETLRTRESEVAVADATCYQEAGLTALTSAAQDAAEKAVAEQQSALLDAYRAMAAHSVERAAQMVSSR